MFFVIYTILKEDKIENFRTLHEALKRAIYLIDNDKDNVRIRTKVG